MSEEETIRVGDMFTNKEKQSMVEKGINEFAVNGDLRDFIKWLIEEYDAVFDMLIKKKCEECCIRQIHGNGEGKQYAERKTTVPEKD